MVLVNEIIGTTILKDFLMNIQSNLSHPCLAVSADLLYFKLRAIFDIFRLGYCFLFSMLAQYYSLLSKYKQLGRRRNGDINMKFLQSKEWRDFYQ